MGSCCGRVPLARSSCCIPILWVERGILGPRWEGDCLPWLLFLGRLAVCLLCWWCWLAPCCQRDPHGIPGELAFADGLLFPDQRVGSQGWTTLSCRVGGPRTPCLCRSPRPGPKDSTSLFPTFRALLWLSLSLFPALTAVFCGADLGKTASAMLPGSEARFSFCVLNSLSPESIQLFAACGL